MQDLRHLLFIYLLSFYHIKRGYLSEYYGLAAHSYYFTLLLGVVSAKVNLGTTQSLIDPKILVSSNAVFKLGFFSPADSSSRYVGIWYSNRNSDGKLEVVWVANRDNPLSDSSGVLKISEDGNLQVLNGQNKSFWSSNVPAHESSNSIIQLLDTGNLVVLSNASGTTVWQSFDHPTDVFLPEMSFTIDGTLTQKQTLFRSWKSPTDPSGGNFTIGVKTRTPPQVLLWDNDRPYWRNGPWNGNLFVGVKSVLSIVTNAGKVYFGYTLADQSAGLLHFVLNYDGGLVQKNWDSSSRKWVIVWNSRQSECDSYGKCGLFGSCKATNSPICSCLRGFVPNNNTEWSKGNWTGGCVRRNLLQCGNVGTLADGFWKLQNVKVPDNAEFSSTASENECSSQCLGECSCLAYAYFSSIGCMIWNGSLIDIQEFYDDNEDFSENSRGIDLSIRLAYTDLGISNQQQNPDVPAVWAVVECIITVRSIAGIFVIIFFLFRRYCGDALSFFSFFHYFSFRCKVEALLCSHIQQMSVSVEGTRRVPPAKILLREALSVCEFGDLPMFKLEKLVTATNNFQESNKLGRGGFGTVYKGKLEDGVEVAVKRLSKVSGQGLTEFMTEVLVISKLQHRNLVRLLGCCIDGEEKLLVYEYMPNKSLDALLFDRIHQELLGWKTRFNIIQGICRGLLYLHRDSRLRVIHRDLKASNILLDAKLTPKISDFGMARIFGGNEDQADTNRVVGTYGYMSPEYAMEGRFSEKSDVFSFGVLLLEIVSGRRNSSFKDEESLSLLAYAWKLWNEDDIVSLFDPAISELGFQDEILRCIQVALLCVQELPEDRPNMSIVISMIDSELSNLPQPSQPGFTQRRHALRNQALQDENVNGSVNLISLSGISGR